MDCNYPSRASAPITHAERHHNNETYALPSDTDEAQRLQFQHDLLRTIFNDTVVLAPLKLTPGAEVLDIGTGTGAWALDFVSKHPTADKTSLLCIDIGARLFPQYPPANITFQLGDILKQDAREWENRFAFVHQRLLLFALKYEQWDDVASKIYNMTAPGGWAQLLEGNPFSHCPGDCGPATTRALEVLKALENASGLDFLCSLRLEGLMKKAGFTDVRVTLREVPVGAFHNDMGAKFSRNMIAIFRGFKTPVLRLGGLGLIRDEHDYDDLMDQVKLEWDASNSGYGIGWYVVVGRKA